MINIIYKTSIEHYLDYEYLISTLKENFNKLLFLGNKRYYNADNKDISQNENKLDNVRYINNKNTQKNDNMQIINQFELNNYLEEQNDEIKVFNETKIIIENVKNIINGNNNINLNEEEELGDIKKVIRYKKCVYVNKLILEEKGKIKKKRKKREINFKRISKYRGVSKNGAGWQTIMMFKRNKPYIGTYSTEELAARIYDIASIKKFGIKSKTNFLYNNEQISKILNANIDFKDPNISKVVSELIK